MHACLYNEDIFVHILRFVVVLNHLSEHDPLAGYHQEWDYNPTLVSLARTCKTFMQPSLDVIWGIIPSLAPLLKTFPDGVCDEHLEEFLSTHDLGHGQTWHIVCVTFHIIIDLFPYFITVV